jgi:hypothetical protein
MSMTVNAQNYFYKTYNGGLYDSGQGACEIPDQHYAVTGSTSSIDESSQAFIMVIDSLGNQIWTKGYGEEGTNWGRRIFHRENEGYWMMGYSTAYGDGDYDFVLWKIDDSGDLEWTRSYGTQGWDRLWDAVELDNGDFILVGETEGENSQDKDALFIRIDEDGNEVWINQLENPGDDIAYAASVYDDTTVIVVGEYFENQQNVGLLLNMHIDGSMNDQWTYDDEGPATFLDVDVFDEEVYVCGRANITSLDYYNSIVLRLDSGNNILFSEIGNTEGDDYGNNILVLGNDRVYWTLKTTAPFFNVFSGGWDAFIFKYHVEMYFIGPTYPTSGIGDDEYQHLLATSDGGYIAVGYCSDDRINESAGNNVMVVKVGPNDERQEVSDENQEFLFLKEIKGSMSNELSIYPNPVNDFVYIPKELSDFKLEAYNPMGQKVNYERLGNKLFINNGTVGIYFLSFSNGTSKVNFRVIKN